MKIAHKPFAMGLLMGLMMLWMLHGQLTGNAMSGPALAVFIGMHLALAAIVIIGGLFAARLSPRMKAKIDRLHRPSLRHAGWMLGGAVVSAAIVHLTLHGITL